MPFLARGRAVRDPSLFQGRWSQSGRRRAEGRRREREGRVCGAVTAAQRGARNRRSWRCGGCGCGCGLAAGRWRGGVEAGCRTAVSRAVKADWVAVEMGEEGGGRVGDVVLFFAQLRARLGGREGADWIRKRRGTRRVIRRER